MSVTKAFVATALATLEDEGKIDLQKPVEYYLPELKGSDWAGTRLRDVAGQLVYINRDKDVVVAYSGTNLTADPKLEPLPCRIIGDTFF